MRYFYTLLALLCVVPCFAQAEESRLFIAPGRETFLHFPSDTFGDKYNLRVYLPEDPQAQSMRHPVIYLLGWEKDSRDDIKDYLKHTDALVVWVDFTKTDFEQNSENIVRFFLHELLPYIDTNYFTLDTPEKRILATHGQSAAETALALLQKPNLFNFLAARNAGNALAQLHAMPEGARISVTGKQPELAAAQRSLTQAGAQFAAQFVLHYSDGNDKPLAHVEPDYFFAEEQALQPVKMQAFLSEKQLPLQADAAVHLLVTATLKNKTVSVFIPETLRLSPPFLNWDARSGKLSVLAGAEAGKIKISGEADKWRFKTALKLKKP